jgi:hypothetical protein
LEETLFRRWELLGICHMKLGDRKVRFSQTCRPGFGQTLKLVSRMHTSPSSSR